MRLPLGKALRSAGRYVARNPMSVMKVARHALSMRVAVPLDAIRWFVGNLPGGDRAPADVSIYANPPAIAVGATVDLMGTTVRASASIAVDEMRVHSEEIRVVLRVTEVDLQLVGDSQSPVAALLKSGALDLSRPGNLVQYMPHRPPALVEAFDDTVVLDLMRMPKFSRNSALRRVLARLTPVVNVAALKTEDDMLLVALQPMPFGVARALNPARA